MKQPGRLKWILICLIGLSYNLSASDNPVADSVKVAQVANGFYNWYLAAIKEKSYPEFQPVFVETKGGMTILDFARYIENLKAHGFSDSLILKEKQSYSVCIENLEKVKYSEFKKTAFTDLDESEQASCDFGNYYRWIGGQEPVDGIRITDIKFTSENYALVSIDYFDNDDKSDKNITGVKIL
jgi:hypothetical protein